MSQEENGGTFIRITNREIWDRLEQLSDEVKGLRGDVQTLTEMKTDDRRRIKALEQRVYVGLAGVVSGWGASVAIFMSQRGH